MGEGKNYMRKGSNFVKVMILTLVIALLGSQSIFAETTTGGDSAPRMKFDDVPSTHWALKHVTKLALHGIIKGKSEKLFDPEAPVSQQEVIVMAIRMMGLEEQVQQKNASYMFPFDMDDWAKPYVDEAINQRLINIQEEAAASTSSKAWGSREASREWVAKIVIRALGMQDEAAKLNNTPTVFKDNKDITASYLGFINAAVNLKIVGGFTDATFKPLDKVTRAQMATFLSRADQYLEQRPANVSIGYVAQFTNSKLSIVDTAGKLIEYSLGEGIVFYSVRDEAARIPSSNIKENMKVYIIHDQGRAYYVEDLDEERSTSESIQGILQSVNLNQMNLSLLTEAGAESYKISSSIVVVGEDGKGSSLGQLVSGSQLEIQKWGDTIDKIVIRSVPTNKTGEATLVSINLEAAHMTWMDEETGQSERYVYSGQLTILYQDKTLTLDQVNQGDIVQYRIENDILTQLVVKTPVVEPFSSNELGKLVSVDSKEKIIVISAADGSLSSYRINDQIQIHIEGMTAPKITDLVIGDDLSIDLNEKIVRQISVLNRSVKAKMLSTIRAYDKELQSLTVLDSDQKLHIYYLKPSTTIMYEGSPVNINNFENYFLRGKKVDITASSDQMISISLSTKYEGTLEQINTVTGNLTLRLKDDTLITFKLSQFPLIDTVGSNVNAINTLKTGDKILATLNPTQDEVVGITVQRSVVYRLESRDLVNRKIVLREPMKDVVTYTLPANVPLQNTTGGAITLAEIPLNSAVSVTFFGSVIEKVQTVQTVRGEITAIDSGTGKLTVRDYHGSEQVIVMGSSPMFIREGTLLTGLDAIKVGDRVEVMSDTNSRTYIYVALEMKKIVSSYDTFSKQINFKRAGINDQATYSFHSNAYIHDGDRKSVV